MNGKLTYQSLYTYKTLHLVEQNSLREYYIRLGSWGLYFTARIISFNTLLFWNQLFTRGNENRLIIKPPQLFKWRYKFNYSCLCCFHKVILGPQSYKQRTPANSSPLISNLNLLTSSALTGLSLSVCFVFAKDLGHTFSNVNTLFSHNSLHSTIFIRTAALSFL